MAIGKTYETVAASQTAQVMGTNGAQGDHIERVVIVPGTSAAGVVTLLDGSTSISLFAGGGTTALSDLKPLVVELNMYSKTGPWKITTGANVTAIAVGDFTTVTTV
jgi:hypothetical protein